MKKLGEILLEKKKLTKSQLEKALYEQEKSKDEKNKKLLGRLLIELGFLNYSDLLECLEEQIIPQLQHHKIFKDISKPIGYVNLFANNNLLLSDVITRIIISNSKFDTVQRMLKDKNIPISLVNKLITSALYHACIAGVTMRDNNKLDYLDNIGIKSIITGLTGNRNRCCRHIVFYDITQKPNIKIERLINQLQELLKYLNK